MLQYVITTTDLKTVMLVKIFLKDCSLAYFLFYRESWNRFDMITDHSDQ